MKPPKNKQAELSMIYGRLSVNGHTEDLSTQRKCRPADWDKQAGRVKGNKEEARSINAWLDLLYARAHQCRQELYAAGKPFTARQVRKLMQGEELEPSKMLSEVWNYQLNYIIGLIGKDYSKATLEKYQAGYKALKKFLQLKYQTDDLRLDQLDHQFVKDYEYYLKTGHHVQNNTAIQIIKKLRTIVRIAMDFGWLQRDPFIAHRMRATEVHRDYLTGEELARLATKRFSKKLSVVRDLFLFSCYTGLSYADTVKLAATDLVTENGETWIQTHRIKNNNRVRVPLLPPAKLLLQHYAHHPRRPEGKLLPNISNQKANAYLKDITRELGLNKRLTYHCARHTFATTVTLTNGVPLETVGQMLGHRSIKSTQHYARVTDTKVRTDMQPVKKIYTGQALTLVTEAE
ncbi:site-specific integrase [Mucilaginibacter segetis]|uniref:Site-specific integrase n=1 Tax=Mucilaginibacter segetis TaxID=2793071 RepID=A0A934UMF3_9SPHI|nr:site-specific integrase [Mucilaginibacter segetis]MBK0379344.1 site-specific integrase [Mucilaginibacter segetis]